MSKTNDPIANGRVYIRTMTIVRTIHELGVEMPGSGESKEKSKHVFQTKEEEKKSDVTDYPICTPSNTPGITTCHRFFLTQDPNNPNTSTLSQQPIQQPTTEIPTQPNQHTQSNQPNQQEQIDGIVRQLQGLGYNISPPKK